MTRSYSLEFVHRRQTWQGLLRPLRTENCTCTNNKKFWRWRPANLEQCATRPANTDWTSATDI